MSVTFFVANNGVNGAELWRTDRTTGNTVLLKDIFPGSTGSSITNLTIIDGIAYFAANDGTNGSELWRSDGTADGTFMLKDINSGNGSSMPSGNWNFIKYNGLIYFTADDGMTGPEL